ncbi:MAG: hypothetical protein FD180_2098 [Planctomycetota bacterium]|nr:MAG: hypothetical protein FD180_2098 [Planctomycetota bacterium]
MQNGLGWGHGGKGIGRDWYRDRDGATLPFRIPILIPITIPPYPTPVLTPSPAAQPGYLPHA